MNTLFQDLIDTENRPQVKQVSKPQEDTLPTSVVLLLVGIACLLMYLYGQAAGANFFK